MPVASGRWRALTSRAQPPDVDFTAARSSETLKVTGSPGLRGTVFMKSPAGAAS